VRIYTTATVTSVPDPMLLFGETFGIGSTQISYGSLLMLALFVVAGFVLRSTRAGRAVYAVGDNPEAARLAGIRTNRVLLGVYTVAALSSGIAGLLLVARTGVGDPQAGQTGNLDVGAKSEIYQLMNELTKRGVGILMISSELPEVQGMSDRVLVMREGTIVGELARAEASEEAIMKYAVGGELAQA